ncbi:hypothetical protein CEXT_205041 [Caerostris extrusa]|uniref:Uncharacterized protein n=1 Tax=Caerostris extrusa TaxID=172846 RepID=A0AAV4W182_CAEEX|nr:hypothetical protein CEXT_205041 [Caerostris extrusa]
MSRARKRNAKRGRSRMTPTARRRERGPQALLQGSRFLVRRVQDCSSPEACFVPSLLPTLLGTSHDSSWLVYCYYFFFPISQREREMLREPFKLYFASFILVSEQGRRIFSSFPA